MNGSSDVKLVSQLLAAKAKTTERSTIEKFVLTIFGIHFVGERQKIENNCKYKRFGKSLTAY